MLFCHVLLFQNQLFRKIISGILSECQTVCIEITPDVLFGPDLVPICLQKLSVDDSRGESFKVNIPGVLYPALKQSFTFNIKL